MSEYQYYYFEAVDTPLTDKQQQELRKISTRADINSRRFVNEYNYGDLKADPLNLMKKYFDIHLYYANWGTRVIMFRIPRDRIDFDVVKQYENFESFDIHEIGRNLIFQLTADTDDNDEWWEESLEIKKYVSLRDDLMAGDYRCLYIAWLAHLHDEDEDEDDCDPPPQPAGMKNLTGTLKSFAEFMYIDKATLKKAVQNAGDNPGKPTVKEAGEWIAALSEKDKSKILSDLLLEKEQPQVLQRDLLSRFHRDRSKTAKEPTPTPKKSLSCQKKTAKKGVKKASNKK